jgi:hypothetical protein
VWKTRVLVLKRYDVVNDYNKVEDTPCVAGTASLLASAFAVLRISAFGLRVGTFRKCCLARPAAGSAP